MTRPVSPGRTPRPTLFSATPVRPPLRTEATTRGLRMLSRRETHVDRAGARSRLRFALIASGVVLATATGGTLVVRMPLAPPAAPTVPTPASRAPVASSLPASAAPGAAVIESMAPARAVASPGSVSDPSASAVAAAAQPARRAPIPPVRRSAPAQPPSEATRRAPTADADVDLLAAMVTRLRAAEASAEAASAATKGGAGDLADDSRAAAR